MSSGGSRSGAHRFDAVESVDELRRELEKQVQALAQAQAEAALQGRVLQELERLSALLRSGLDGDDLLQELLSVFSDNGKAERALICVRDGDALRLRGLRALHPRQPLPSSQPLAIAQVLKGRAPAELEPVTVASRGDSALGGYAFGADERVLSVVEIALVNADRLVGAICLGLLQPRGIDADDQRVLQALTSQATAIVVELLARTSLEQAIRSRDGILGIVAHDLRNPLNVISAAANSLHHRLPDSLTRRPVERIMRAAQRAEHLIRDLLDISAIEGGHFSIDKHPLETTNTLLAAIESQQGLAASASVILASDLSPELPSVEADEERILELLENLVGNAVKFTMAGGTVTVGAAARGAELLIWVKDNGPGIAAEQLPHVFDRFWQASKRDRRGAGLGLTICRAIVEAHGGRIWAESKVGEGTTVFFTIPAGGGARQPREASVASILLVDDRPENLLSLKAILERPDYRLVSARSGEEALSLALRQPFAVALIDVAMPGMDGLEVAVHMKELERSRDIPIIFITAFGDDPQEVHRAYSAGGADYLVKPLDTEIVRKKVAVFVDLSRRRQEAARALNQVEE
jgi:signal transduction histidine kinase/ActR/RegA family two-component response regulator